MTNPAASRRKGADWEIALTEFFRDRGHDAEWLHLSGKNDEGDVGVRALGRRHLVEAKNDKSFSFSEWVTEMHAERINYAKARRIDLDNVHGLVVVKRPRAKIWESYVVKTLADELLLWEAL